MSLWRVDLKFVVTRDAIWSWPVTVTECQFKCCHHSVSHHCWPRLSPISKGAWSYMISTWRRPTFSDDIWRKSLACTILLESSQVWYIMVLLRLKSAESSVTEWVMIITLSVGLWSTSCSRYLTKKWKSKEGSWFYHSHLEQHVRNHILLEFRCYHNF